jgi:hypothetical protein
VAASMSTKMTMQLTRSRTSRRLLIKGLRIVVLLLAYRRRLTCLEIS